MTRRDALFVVLITIAAAVALGLLLAAQTVGA
jgi:hypothetical protein